jgi:tRNA G26 N,N-dimethylase Trm1
MVENGVFYNPVQIFNRDFTLLVMQAYINQQRIQSKLCDNI